MPKEKELLRKQLERLAEQSESAVDSLGLQVGEYSQIILFRDEDTFLSTLKVNPHLQALFGTKGCEKQLFPGCYIAAITSGKEETAESASVYGGAGEF